MTLVAIMAAEERRKQKEQIKILKQQVGLLCGCADCIFPFFSLSKCPDTHTLPVSTAGNVELLFFDPLKLTFQLPLLLVVLNLLL